MEFTQIYISFTLLIDKINKIDTGLYYTLCLFFIVFNQLQFLYLTALLAPHIEAHPVAKAHMAPRFGAPPAATHL